MLKMESEHYIFYYHLDSLAQQEINQIVNTQEQCYRYISGVLGVILKNKIEYFLCLTPQEVGKYYGDNEPCHAFARRPNQVFAVYNENVKCIGFHEDAHLISYQLNRPPSVAMREGLAMFFDKKWWGISTLDWTIFYLRRGCLPSISDLFIDDDFYQLGCELTYPVMGQFTEYLILTFGMDAYKQFYQYEGETIKSHFQSVFNKSVASVEKDFTSYLNLFALDEIVEKRMHELLEDAKKKSC